MTYTFRSRESWRSPWADYGTLRNEHPVHHVAERDQGEFWVLSRFDDVFRSARDTATFSSAKGLTPGDNMEMFARNSISGGGSIRRCAC